MKLILDIDTGSTILAHKELGSETVNVETSMFDDISDVEIISSISEQLYTYCKQNNKTKICFNHISEGFIYNTLNFIDKIAKYLIHIYNFDPNNFFILSGSMPDSVNITYYDQACQKFNWLRMGLLLVNNWEELSAAKTIKHLDFYNNFNNEIKVKSKKFVCYNRSIKSHRLMLCAEMIKRNLIGQSYYSMKLPADDGIEPYYDKIRLPLQTYFPNIHQSIIDIYNQHSKIFPLWLGLSEDAEGAERSHRIIDSDRTHWEDAYFIVITETKFFHDVYDDIFLIKSDLSLNCVLISEKTFKCIQGKNPFILAGFTGSLACLRNYGYKTFHPYINEEYDNIENDEERLLAIANEIERLCNLSDQEFLEWQRKLRPIIEHNYNLLKSCQTTILKSLPK